VRKNFAAKHLFLCCGSCVHYSQLFCGLLGKYLLVSELKMLTLLDEYFSTTTTIFSGWILHGSLSLAWKFVHAVLEHGDFVNIYFTTRLRCGRIFNNYFTANLLLNQAVKEFWKSIKIWRSYRREYCGMGFLRCIGYKTTANALRRVSERRSRLCMGQHRDAACQSAGSYRQAGFRGAQTHMRLAESRSRPLGRDLRPTFCQPAGWQLGRRESRLA